MDKERFTCILISTFISFILFSTPVVGTYLVFTIYFLILKFSLPIWALRFWAPTCFMEKMFLRYNPGLMLLKFIGKKIFRKLFE